MDAFQKEIDERTNLTSSNKFELLLFRLGTPMVPPTSRASCMASTSSRSARSFR
jgi:hypothetical protein